MEPSSIAAKLDCVVPEGRPLALLSNYNFSETPRQIGRQLDLSEGDMDNAFFSIKENRKEQYTQVIILWRKAKREKATWNLLLRSLEEEKGLAEHVNNILTKKEEIGSRGIPDGTNNLKGAQQMNISSVFKNCKPQRGTKESAAPNKKSKPQTYKQLTLEDCIHK